MFGCGCIILQRHFLYTFPKMKTKLPAGLLLLLFAAATACAARFDRRRSGVEAAMNWNGTFGSKHNSKDDEFTYGGKVAVNYKMTNRHGWFFEPALAFSYGDYTFYDEQNKEFDSHLTSIELPVKFGHDFSIPVLDLTAYPLVVVKPVFAIGGHLTVDGENYRWNPFNIAAGVGFGFLFMDKFGLNITSDFNLLKSIRRLPGKYNIDNHNAQINIAAKFYF